MTSTFWFVSFPGLTDDCGPQDGQIEGTDDGTMTLAQEAFVQGSLEAHEEFLEQHRVELEQESSAVKMEEWEEAEDDEQAEQSGVEDQEEVETEEEHLQLLEEPLVTDAPSQTLGPGPLVTDMEDMDELETIFLSLKNSLRVDDLPDLPELEAPPSLFSLEQTHTPNMGVVSCSSDDDDENAVDNLSRVVPAFALEREPPFTLAPETKPPHSKAASLVYPEDEDLLELQTHSIFGATAKPRPLIAPSRPSCLIEEIDDF